MENNKGKYVLITGATSGIGFALAKLFAKDGFSLIIIGRYQDSLDKAAMELTMLKTSVKLDHDIDIITIQKDLFNPQAAFEIYDEVKAKGLTVEILVNDAGQGTYGMFAETDIINDLDIIQLNVNSLVVLTKLFLREMINRNSGKILQLGSIASKLPTPLHAVYGGTKAFILYFSEALASELEQTNVTVTTLMPGPTDTDFFNKGGFENTKLVKDGNLADVETVAEDGYNALMNGETRVVSGLKNKMQVNMPDVAGAEQIKKLMEQKD